MTNESPNTGQARRVLHVITPRHMAGAETYLVRLLRRANGAQVTHGCISKCGPAVAEMRCGGATVETLGIGGKANLLAMPRILRAARRFNADVLHSHLSSASWWCGWLEQLGGLPSIGHVHGFTSALWHRRQRYLIACSEAVKRDLVAKGIPADRITVLHNPVDPQDAQPTRARAETRALLGIAADVPLVGTFGHLAVKKGYRELVQAAAIVCASPAAQFWCFGEGPLRDELQKTARELGIADRFRLFGFRRDVPDLMRAIDVMCLPSHREPFGLVYLEAALAEKPVIACDAGGAPEVVVHGETGLLVPPPAMHKAATGGRGNIQHLADAILTLMDNRSQAAAMGRRGRELVLERFGWSDYLARLNELYERVLARDVVGASVLPRIAELPLKMRQVKCVGAAGVPLT